MDPLCTPSSALFVDAPSALKEVICTAPFPLLVDAPFAMKEVSEYPGADACAMTDAGVGSTDLAIGSFLIGDDRDEDATATYIAALEERIAKLDVDHDLTVLGDSQVEKRVFALERMPHPRNAWLSLAYARPMTWPPSLLPSLLLRVGI